jgi:hypothetical protein
MHRAKQVDDDERPAEPVNGPGHHDIELAPVGILKQGIEPRPLVASLGTTDAGIAVDLNDGPATTFGDFLEFAHLVFDRLVIGADRSSGPSRNWVKTKCPGWKRINAGRDKMFEGSRKPELTEAQKTLAKKRKELARVLERLRSPGLTFGLARELRKNIASLEREIAELAFDEWARQECRSERDIR